MEEVCDINSRLFPAHLLLQRNSQITTRQDWASWAWPRERFHSCYRCGNEPWTTTTKVNIKSHCKHQIELFINTWNAFGCQRDVKTHWDAWANDNTARNLWVWKWKQGGRLFHIALTCYYSCRILVYVRPRLELNCAEKDQFPGFSMKWCWLQSATSVPVRIFLQRPEGRGCQIRW